MVNAKQLSSNLALAFAFACLFVIYSLFPGLDIVASASSNKNSSPAETANNAAHRSVLQVIDNTIYHWLEYENPGSGSFFIYKLSPEKVPLNANGASLLLARSRQWEKSFSQITFNTGAAKYNFSTETNNHVETELKVELPSESFNFTDTDYTPGQRMIDDRTPITGEEATKYPYNTAGFLSISFPSTDSDSKNLMRATAFIISPYTIITNAHCLYANDNGGLFESAKFYPGQYEQNSETVNPYAMILPAGFDIDENFIYYEDLFYETNNQTFMIEAVKYDLAALFTEEPISDISTYIPLEFNLSSNPSDVSLAGYPGEVRGTESKGMWLSEGPIISSEDNILKYEAYTSGGNSGSPIIYYNQQADTYRIIAIHSFTPEDISYSGGPYFGDHNSEIIMEWLRFTPEINGDSDGNDLEPEEPEQPMPGDVNGDGEIDVQDVVLTIRHALEIELLSGGALERADVNGDGEIDILDVTLIMRFSLGLIDSF